MLANGGRRESVGGDDRDEHLTYGAEDDDGMEGEATMVAGDEQVRLYVK